MFGFITKKRRELLKLSFVETHEYRFQRGGSYLRIEVRGRDYRRWTHIEKVLGDINIKAYYKGKTIDYLAECEQEASNTLNTFCECIVDWERRGGERSKIAGNLKEFYIIENI